MSETAESVANAKTPSTREGSLVPQGSNADLEYWQDKLAGIAAVSSIPAQWPRNTARSCEIDKLVSELPEALAERLRFTAADNGVTLFEAIYAALSIVVSRYADCQDVVIGSVAEKRESQPATNYLVLRRDVDGRSYQEHLVDSAKAVREAQQHNSLPFGQLLESLNVEGHPGVAPIFQIFLCVIDADDDGRSGDPRSDTGCPDHAGRPPSDLRVEVRRSNSSLRITWAFNTALFERAYINGLSAALRCLVEQAIDDPLVRVDRHGLLGRRLDAAQLAFSYGAHTSAPATPWLARFGDCVRHYPLAAAIRIDQVEISYEDLGRKVGALSNRLRALGISRDSVVAIRINKNENFFVATLALACVGATSCPIHPELDVSRVAHILRETGAGLILVDEDSGAMETYVELLDVGAVAALESVDMAAITGPAPKVAYILYTSGSTGVPKGVPVSSDSLDNYLEYAAAKYFDSLDGAALVTSPFFDISVPAIWLPLLSGKTLEILPEGEEVAVLARRCAEGTDAPAQLLRMTPTHLRLLLEFMGECPAREHVRHTFVVGGERFPVDLALQARKRFPCARMFNHYGPTETTVGCAIFDIAELSADSQVVPIGTPMDNVVLHVLDAWGHASPIGVAGTLHIGGDGVAAGYLAGGDKDRVFTQDVLGIDPCTRFYCSGDIVRWNCHGQLEYIGRNDSQAKLRGYRIELQEIETCIRAFPGVSEAVAMVREVNGAASLVAYFAGSAAMDATSPSALREYMNRALPKYMLPSHIVAVERFPVSPNGKIDLSSLPGPVTHAISGQDSLSQSATERRLAGIWQAVLGLDAVKRSDNFFDQGGHSLLAMKLIRLIQKEFFVKLTFRSIFLYQTLEAMAAAIDQLSEPTIALSPKEATPVGPVSLSFNQERLLFLSDAFGANSAYSLPSAHRIVGDLDIDRLCGALRGVVSRHRVLRTVFPKGTDGVVVPAELNGASLAIGVKDLSGVPDGDRHERARELILQESTRPFDLAIDFPIRACILRLAAAEHLLLLNFHHIAVDGRSMEIIFSEIGALYDVQPPDIGSAFPTLPCTYADFAALERKRFDSGELLEGLNFWRTTLEGAPELHGLPLDFARTAQQSMQGAEWVTEIDSEVLSNFKSLCGQAGATLFMGLTTLYGMLIHRYSGQDDIVIGTAVANREREEFDRLVGYFANTVPLRIQVSPDSTFGSLVREFRETCLKAFTHQSVPFDRVVDRLKPTRSLAHSPVFQLAIGLQDKAETPLTLGRTSIASERITTGTSKFDLSLNIEVRPGRAVAQWAYNSDIFCEEKIRGLSSTFVELLKSVLSSVDVKIDRLDFLDASERYLLTRQIGRNRRNDALELNLAEHFALTSRRAPSAIAIRHRDRAFTYSELDERSAELANALRQAGAAPYNRIGIRISRSFDLVAAVIAVHRIGATCVPLDIEYPISRIESMSKVAKISLAITSPDYFQETSTVIATVVDICSAAASASSRGADFRADLSDPAYILFTSGSTGVPKGSLLSQRAVLNRVVNTDYVAFNAEDHVGQMSNSSFDPFPWEVWGAICAGATLHIADKETILDPRALGEWIRKENISKLIFTVAVLNNLVANVPHALSKVDTVVFGSDKVDVEQIKRLLAGGKPRKLLHAYGPTECVTLSTVYEIAEEAALIHPIGRPVTGTSCYVLTPGDVLAPFGAFGEIAIGGESVADMYVGDPDLTARKFIELDLDDGLRERVYKTGDTARWLPSMDLEFVGRTDSQVKFRGFRIELGEIATLLLQRSDVHSAVVIRRIVGVAERLVAYVVPNSGARGAGDLIGYLARLLPAYMVPTDVVELAALPLTANGKVDYAALPAPEPALQMGVGQLETEVERCVQKIWKRRLGLEFFDTQLSFFQLGGHSILVAGVLADIRQELSVTLTFAQFFADPTILGLARSVADSSANAGEGATEVVPLPSRSVADDELEFI